MKKSIEVLVVDDQMELINSIEPFFEIHEGIKLKGKANSGRECLQLLEKINPDVILMDIKMESPKAGMETAKRIIETGTWFGKIIFLTAYPLIEDIKKSLDIKCSFIDKQCSIPRVIQMIEEVFYRDKLIVEIQSP